MRGRESTALCRDAAGYDMEYIVEMESGIHRRMEYMELEISSDRAY